MPFKTKAYAGPKSGKSERHRARQRLMSAAQRKRHEAGVARMRAWWPA